MSDTASAKTSSEESVHGSNPVLWDLDQRGVATVTSNRPEVNDAYDAGLIDEVLRGNR